MMNMHVFRLVAERAFREEFGRDATECPEVFEQIMLVFDYFFKVYRQKMKKDHPHLKRANVRKLMRSMLDDHAEQLGSPEWFHWFIDLYFNTQFQLGCDRNINHFLSGDVLKILHYELRDIHGWF